MRPVEFTPEPVKSKRLVELAVELEQLTKAVVEAEEKSVLLAAQGEEQADALPALEDGLRQAQTRANEQRGSVTQVQQQIQVLATEQRNIEEQSRQLNQRRERLAAPDEARLLDAQLKDLQERRVTAETRFEELDMQLAVSQERRDQLDDKVTDAERALSSAREQLRLLERSAQEATFALRSLQARRGELQRSLVAAARQPAEDNAEAVPAPGTEGKRKSNQTCNM